MTNTQLHDNFVLHTIASSLAGTVATSVFVVRHPRPSF